MSGQFIAGAAVADITPPLSVPELGRFNQRHQFFTGVHDSLFAKALYCADANTESLVITVNAIGLNDKLLGPQRSFIAELRTRASQATGVPVANIMLAADHVHTTPEMLGFRPLIRHPGAQDWLASLIDKIAQAANQAKTSAKPRTMRIGKGHVSDVGVNRVGLEYTDTELTVITLEASPEDRIVLLHFALHPVIMQVWPFVSADFVGAATRRVETSLPGKTTCLFLQGACGDIDPLRPTCHDYAECEKVGAAIASEAITVIGQPHTPQPARVSIASRQVSLPSRQLPAGDELATLQRKAHEGDHGAIEQMVRVAEGTGPFDAEVQLLQLGDCALIAIPGELFCETGLTLKRESQPLIALPVCYANGYLGYFTPAHRWTVAGYEAGLGPWCKAGPEAVDLLLNTARLLLRDLPSK